MHYNKRRHSRAWSAGLAKRCVRSLDSLPQPTTSRRRQRPWEVGGNGSPRITLGNRNGREIPRVTNDGSDRSNMRYPRPADIRESRKFPWVTGKFGRDPRKFPRVTDFRGSRITLVRESHTIDWESPKHAQCARFGGQSSLLA